jgi:hypothetical protein
VCCLGSATIPRAFGRGIHADISSVVCSAKSGCSYSAPFAYSLYIRFTCRCFCKLLAAVTELWPFSSHKPDLAVCRFRLLGTVTRLCLEYCGRAAGCRNIGVCGGINLRVHEELAERGMQWRVSSSYISLAFKSVISCRISRYSDF